MSETFHPLPSMAPSPPPSGRAKFAAAGEFAGAAFVLALAGAAIWLLATTLAAGSVSGDGSEAVSTMNPPPRLTETWDSTHEPSPEVVHVFIVVVSEERAEAIRRDLAVEATIRGIFSEAPRDAEVISATSEAEAEQLAATINDQANMHGVAPMAAIVAR